MKKLIALLILIAFLLIPVNVFAVPTYGDVGPTTNFNGDVGTSGAYYINGTLMDLEDIGTAGLITEAMLKGVDNPADEEILTYESTTGDFEWQTAVESGIDLSLYYLKTAIDTQGEMETIWGVDLANAGDLHATTTVTTTNGLSIIGQEISLQAASTNTHGALTDTDWNTFNNKQASLTFGIADTNKVQINQADVANNDYAKFTTTGLSGRSYSEVLSDLGIDLSLYYLKTAIDTKAEMDAIWGVTVATTANKLSAFAATTSAELAGVISDETGTGALVFRTSPTIYLPVIKGTTASDLPTYSAEFLDADNWTSTDWTGSWAAGWSHPVGTIETISLGSGGSGYVATEVITVVQSGGSLGTVTINTVDGSGVILTCTRLAKGSGYSVANGLAVTGGSGNSATINILTINNATVLSHDHAAVNATKYQIAYTVSGYTAGSFTITFSGQSLAGITATGAWGPTTTSTAALQITPTSTFVGTIVISIKSITAVSTPVQTYQSSEGTVRTEIRANTGLNNTFSGNNAGGYNTTGVFNSAVGAGALQYNTTGQLNSAVGANALYYNTTGNNNFGLGGYALLNNTIGNNNIALGAEAARYQADGTTVLADPENSLYLGYRVRGYNNSDDNTIVIGYNAIGLGANMVTLGNDSIVRTVLKGNVMIGLNANIPTARLHLPAGTATASTAPLKFTSGTLLTTPEAGTIEFLTNKFYATITSSAVRKTLAYVEKPIITLTKDDATPDVSAGEIFLTVANDAPCAITDLDNPSAGKIITIVCGSSTNACTIADSGNFALSAAWTPDVNDTIQLLVRADNDYVEISRSAN